MSHTVPLAALDALPLEIGFLTSADVAPATLRRAAALARRLGTDAATVLLNEGWIAEEAFYRALARYLGTVFLDRTFVLGEDLRYPQVLTVGAAPLAPGASHGIVAAPRGAAIARLIEASLRMERPPAITTPTRLREALFAQHGAAIAAEASDGLGRRRPEWSCRPGPQTVDLALAGLVLALVLLVTRLPTVTGLVLLALLQAGMLALLTVRLAAAGIGAAEVEASPPDLLPDEALPTYTVFVALYREAAVVPRLVRALGRIDYPVLCSNLTQKR